jgi:hypothetical protein
MIFSLERSTHCCFYSEAITGFKPLSSKTSGISDRIFCEKCGLTTTTESLPEKGQVFALGVGEIVEDNGKKYHAFQNGVQFTFE